MPIHEDRLPRWGQLREWLRIIVRDHQLRAGNLTLFYPPATWYAEHAGEMLRLLVDTTGQLEADLGLTLPPTDCFVSDPETAIKIQGATGMAYRDSTLIGFPERVCPSLPPRRLTSWRTSSRTGWAGRSRASWPRGLHVTRQSGTASM